MKTAQQILDTVISITQRKMLIATEYQINEHNGIKYGMVNEHIALEAMEEYARQFNTQFKWTPTEIMPDYDGQYLCFIEQPQECGNVWKYQQVRDCKMNRWVTLVNEKITYWQPLQPEP